MRRSRNYWTKDRCHEEALKYKTRKEFQTNSKAAYSKARKMGWLDDICSHMLLIHKPPGYWIKERIIEAASECSTRTEFYVKYSAAAAIARNMGWIDEVCAHMEVLRDPTVKIGNRIGYMVITGVKPAIRSFDNKKINHFEYVCDCGNTGSFITTDLLKRSRQHFKLSCGCNMGGYRDTMLLNQSGFNICFECKQTLPISEFGNNKSNKNGLQRSCRECKSKRDQRYRGDPRFREKILNNKKEYYNKIKNTEEYKQYVKIKSETKDYKQEYQRNLSNPDRMFKIRVRNRIRAQLKKKNLTYIKKDSKTIDFLGADFWTVKEYITKQFLPGMTWDNYGDWHIDHIIPLDAAGNDKDLIKILCYYQNLQPLWGSDNLTKSYKIPDICTLWANPFTEYRVNDTYHDKTIKGPVGSALVFEPNVRYGRLLAIEEVEPSSGTIRKKRMIKCLCDCGKIRIVTFNSLRMGQTQSCGCKRRKLLPEDQFSPEVQTLIKAYEEGLRVKGIKEKYFNNLERNEIRNKLSLIIRMGWVTKKQTPQYKVEWSE